MPKAKKTQLVQAAMFKPLKKVTTITADIAIVYNRRIVNRTNPRNRCVKNIAYCRELVLIDIVTVRSRSRGVVGVQQQEENNCRLLGERNDRGLDQEVSREGESCDKHT